jgi:hypothetical protein
LGGVHISSGAGGVCSLLYRVGVKHLYLIHAEIKELRWKFAKYFVDYNPSMLIGITVNNI